MICIKDKVVNTCSVYFLYRKNITGITCTHNRLPLHLRFQNDIFVTSMVLMKECNIYSLVSNKRGLKKSLKCSLEITLIGGEFDNQELVSGGWGGERGLLLGTE